MKILFLEPLLVLNSKSFRQQLLEINGHQYHNFTEHEFEAPKVSLLKEIMDKTNSKMVLYTKERCCSQKIGALLNKMRTCGLSSDYWLDTIPSGGDQYNIMLQWMRNKSHIIIDKYAILDNPSNGNTPDNAHGLFWCKDDGLTSEIAEDVIQFLS